MDGIVSLSDDCDRMRLLLLASIVLAPAGAFAQARTETDSPPAIEMPGADALPVQTHVTPPASPTRVGVGLHVQSLNHVDPPSEIFPHFSATVLLTLRWRDPRLAFEPESEQDQRHIFQGSDAAERLREMWHPDIGFENEHGDRQVDGQTLVIRHDGNVIYEEVLSSRFRARVRLQRFPFDRQRFHFAVQSVTWNVNKVVLEVIDDKTGFQGGNQRGSLEWRVRSLEHQLVRAETARSGHPHARAAFFLIAQRSSGFYLWKLMVPLLLIVAFTWSTFWMTGEAAGTRMQRAFIALLSVVAYHQVVANHLPRIPYLTFMDSTVYLAFAFTAATVVQIVATHRFERAERSDRAARLDRISRVLFPLVFVLGIAGLWVFYRTA